MWMMVIDNFIVSYKTKQPLNHIVDVECSVTFYLSGNDGTDGRNGVTGATGQAGRSGRTGATGQKGSNGNTGATGQSALDFT